MTRDTNLFYDEIAKPFIAQLEDEIPCAYFNIQNYVKTLKNEDKEDDKNLIALLKILSPQHLLKVSFANDSNDSQIFNVFIQIKLLSFTVSNETE